MSHGQPPHLQRLQKLQIKEWQLEQSLANVFQRARQIEILWIVVLFVRKDIPCLLEFQLSPEFRRTFGLGALKIHEVSIDVGRGMYQL